MKHIICKRFSLDGLRCTMRRVGRCYTHNVHDMRAITTASMYGDVKIASPAEPLVSKFNAKKPIEPNGVVDDVVNEVAIEVVNVDAESALVTDVVFVWVVTTAGVSLTTTLGDEMLVTDSVNAPDPTAVSTLAAIALPISDSDAAINASPTSAPVVVTTAGASPGTLIA